MRKTKEYLKIKIKIQKKIKDIESKTEKESLRDRDMFSPENRNQKGIKIVLYNCIKQHCKEDKTNYSHYSMRAKQEGMDFFSATQIIWLVLEKKLQMKK